MKIAELLKLFETYDMNPENYGFEKEEGIFIYHYKDGLKISKPDGLFEPRKERKWVTTPFEGTEEEFLGLWSEDISDYYVLIRGNDPNLFGDYYKKGQILFFILLNDVLSAKPSYLKDDGSGEPSVSIKCADNGEYIFYVEKCQRLVERIHSTCGFLYCNDDGIYECPVSILMNKFDADQLISEAKYPFEVLIEAITWRLRQYIEYYDREEAPYSHATDYYGNFMLFDSLLDYKLYNGDCCGVIYNKRKPESPWEWVNIRIRKGETEIIHNTAANYKDLAKDGIKIK